MPHMAIQSPAFEHHAPIPREYTGDSTDVSPPLRWSEVPVGTQALALIVDDPDAPSGHFFHWVVWNLPPDKSGTEKGEAPAHQGRNGFGTVGWRGPKPPPGRPHRYFFKLYALDMALQLPEGSTAPQVEAAMEGHILATAELIGTYQRH